MAISSIYHITIYVTINLMFKIHFIKNTQYFLILIVLLTYNTKFILLYNATIFILLIFTSDGYFN